MDSSSLVVLCVLLSCSVWMVQGKCVAIDDHQNQNEVEVSETKLPGICFVCKRALEEVKKRLGKNNTAEVIKSKLLSVCKGMGFLKSMCQKFVKNHLWVLVEELSTTDDVRTICVRTKACKPKEKLYRSSTAEIFSGDDMDE